MKDDEAALPTRLLINPPTRSEALAISVGESDDSDASRLRAPNNRAEVEDGGLSDSVGPPVRDTVGDPSRTYRPLVPVADELLARLAEPLRSKGRGPPGVPFPERRPLPAAGQVFSFSLSPDADPDPVREQARFENFSAIPPTDDELVILAPVPMEASFFCLRASTLSGT
jgi:hypothetical protein